VCIWVNIHQIYSSMNLNKIRFKIQCIKPFTHNHFFFKDYTQSLDWQNLILNITNVLSHKGSSGDRLHRG